MKKTIFIFFVLSLGIAKAQPKIDMSSIGNMPLGTIKRKDLDKTIYRVIYAFELNQDSLTPSYVKKGYGVLQIGKTHTKFMDFYGQKSDSVVISYENQKNVNKGKAIMEMTGFMSQRKFEESVVTEISTQKMDVFGTINSPAKFIYKDKNTIKWNFIDEEKEIKGIKCKKATTFWRGRDYTAWYAPEIAMPYGPYKFQGLPGLIFEIYDSKRYFTFSLDSFEKIGFDSPIYVRTDATEIDFKSFRKLEDYSSKDLNGYLKSQGYSIIGLEDGVRPYNPIELILE